MNSNILKITLIFAIAVNTYGCSQEQNKQSDAKHLLENKVVDKNIWPKLDIAVKQDANIEAKVKELMSSMTLEQKVAQMIQPEIRDITVEDMRKYGFGSYLNGGGAFPNNNKHATPADWIKLAEDMYQASIDSSLDGSTIPTMWGTDAVHGHNNVIGATLFPHNIGLGAANNPELIEKIASITANEVMVTGIDWVFAPTVAVVRDDRWGRTYEGYSEDPEIVKSYSAAIVNGLQGHADKDFLSDQRVISTVKHFIGDGGTEGGDDQGNNLTTEQQLFDIHAQGYVGGLTVGAQSVMASFNSWHGKKIHGSKYLLTDVLKERMGFDGFVVGDWNGHGQIKGCSNESCPQAVNAGLDIYMVPTNAWKPLYENTIDQVKSGEISQARIDDAVARILRVKLRAGLFDKPSPANRPLSGKTELIGAKEHRDVARQAVRESLVLLKNNDNILPLMPNQHVLVAGDGADNIGKQSGGWTVTWQGTGNNNNDFPGGTSIYGGINQVVQASGGTTTLSEDGNYEKKPDVAIVVFGEEPYAEGNGDLDNLEYQRGNKKDLELLKKLKAQGIPTISLFISGRPLWVNPELNASDAFVAVWLPGSEGQGISDVIFKKANGETNYEFTGKLSFSWPNSPEQTSVNRFDDDFAPLLPYGYGMQYGDKNTLSKKLPESIKVTKATSKALSLFEGIVKSPWKMVVSNAETKIKMTSNTAKVDGISVRTIDRFVQEDARQITWDGTEYASLAITHDFPEDLRKYNENQSMISLDVKVDSDIEAPIYMSINEQKLDISTELKSLSKNKWHQIHIDLACFVQQGTDMAKIFTPFSLASDKKLTLSFSKVIISPTSSSTLSKMCQ